MDLNSYFEQLAIEHNEIQHTSEKPAFFREYASARILLDTNFHKNLRNCGNNILISQFNDDGNLPVPTNDFNRENPIGTLYIFSRILASEIEDARLTAKGIRDDIYARLKRDMRSQDDIFERGFQIEQISPVTIGRVADNFYGMSLNISYSQKYTAVYDESKWTDTIS